jgi:hypothetical protein
MAAIRVKIGSIGKNRAISAAPFAEVWRGYPDNFFLVEINKLS